MRDLPAAFAAHLAEGVTTLCRCWTLTRRDGAVLGFTDHDRDLVVAGHPHRASSGLAAAEATGELGFAVGGGDVSGALSDEAITEADIAAGLYDEAEVAVRLVNWAAPDQHLLLDLASVGEIRREDDAFVAELRSPLHRLDETRGLVYRTACSADLGDACCRADLDDSGISAATMVADTDGTATLTALGLDAFPDGIFTGGRLLWLDGAANTGPADIRRHRQGDALARFELREPAARPIRPGDGFRVTAGCDKRLATCRDRFRNTANFRGFPHMPGNDFVLNVAKGGEARMDGGSLFR